jgi:hypothetical protein
MASIHRGHHQVDGVPRQVEGVGGVGGAAAGVGCGTFDAEKPRMVLVSVPPASTKDALREAIRTTLARAAGSTPNSRAVAHGTLNTWHQVAARLAPVVGERGVDVLFSRALHLASSGFPWLVVAGEYGAGPAPLAALRARLESQPPADATLASQATFLAFAELLATLIGDPLSERLLAPVWAPPDLEHP